MIYSDSEIIAIVETLVKEPNETERFEFKRTDADKKKIGQYFSALSNESNLKRKQYGWLIFGIDDKTHEIIGTAFYVGERKKLDDLKKDIANMCNMTFSEIYDIEIDGRRVVVFQIPPAIKGSPTKCNGHPYGRDGEHLGALHDDEVDEIKKQNPISDWTNQVLDGFNHEDLDLDALLLAKEGYIKKHHDFDPDIVRNWSSEVFLKKIYAIDHASGNITTGAALLLGKTEVIASYFPWLEMSWKLYDADSNMIAYEHYKAPFVVAANKILSKIRILNTQFLPDTTLMPIEIPSYDDRVLRELLANAICHQDYTQYGRITIQEFPDYLTFSNAGTFYAGSMKEVVSQQGFMPLSYRNPRLKDIMSEIKMIEYAGSGLGKIMKIQQGRYMPLPEDFSNETQVSIRLDGKILDEKYSKLLYYNRDLLVMDVFYLDKIQKKMSKGISTDIIRRLRKNKLIEGRNPNFYISKHASSLLKEKGEYIKNRSFKDTHYKSLIIDYIKTYGSATKKDIDSLLLDLLPGVLDGKKKSNKIRNIIGSMSGKTIVNTGTRKFPVWKIL